MGVVIVEGEWTVLGVNVGHPIVTNWILCLQCFDAVGWAAGRASGL